ncbi:hypothetical protein FRC10_010550, partial [Ceratobasidium sp. 414]
MPDVHPNDYGPNTLIRRNARLTSGLHSVDDPKEPTSPSSPVAAYPPLLIPEDELPSGSAPEFYG